MMPMMAVALTRYSDTGALDLSRGLGVLAGLVLAVLAPVVANKLFPVGDAISSGIAGAAVVGAGALALTGHRRRRRWCRRRRRILRERHHPRLPRRASPWPLRWAAAARWPQIGSDYLSSASPWTFDLFELVAADIASIPNVVGAGEPGMDKSGFGTAAAGWLVGSAPSFTASGTTLGRYTPGALAHTGMHSWSSSYRDLAW